MFSRVYGNGNCRLIRQFGDMPDFGGKNVCTYFADPDDRQLPVKE